MPIFQLSRRISHRLWHSHGDCPNEPSLLARILYPGLRGNPKMPRAKQFCRESDACHDPRWLPRPWIASGSDRPGPGRVSGAPTGASPQRTDVARPPSARTEHESPCAMFERLRLSFHSVRLKPSKPTVASHPKGLGALSDRRDRASDDDHAPVIQSYPFSPGSGVDI